MRTKRHRDEDTDDQPAGPSRGPKRRRRNAQHDEKYDAIFDLLKRAEELSRVMRETYCCSTRGIVFGLVLVGELEVEEGSCIGTLTGLEKGVTGA